MLSQKNIVFFFIIGFNITYALFGKKDELLASQGRAPTSGELFKQDMEDFGYCVNNNVLFSNLLGSIYYQIPNYDYNEALGPHTRFSSLKLTINRGFQAVENNIEMAERTDTVKYTFRVKIPSASVSGVVQTSGFYLNSNAPFHFDTQYNEMVYKVVIEGKKDENQKIIPTSCLVRSKGSKPLVELGYPSGLAINDKTEKGKTEIPRIMEEKLLQILGSEWCPVVGKGVFGGECSFQFVRFKHFLKANKAIKSNTGGCIQ